MATQSYIGDSRPREDRPTEALLHTQSTSNAVPGVQGEQALASRKRRNHRAGKKKKARRQSFAVPEDDEGNEHRDRPSLDLHGQPHSTAARPPFYRLGQSGSKNLSETSLDSSALLDHRDHPPMRVRRESRITQSAFGNRQSQEHHDPSPLYQPGYSNPHVPNEAQHRRLRQARAHTSSGGESDGDDATTSDRTPLLSASIHEEYTSAPGSGYGILSNRGRGGRLGSPVRRTSTATSTSSKRRRGMPSRQQSLTSPQMSHDVNNPPSVPGSPKLGPDMGYDDVMVTGSFAPRPSEERPNGTPIFKEQLIDIDEDSSGQPARGSPSHAQPQDLIERRHTITLPAEEDVCFPLGGMSEIAEEDFTARDGNTNDQSGQRRRRFRQWPDLSVLDEWSREEKEGRSDGIRAKKISEPVLVGGRLRPQKNGWHRAEEDAPYRFTYFNEEIPSTIHSQTISELLQPGQVFRDLFIPDPPELSDESSDDENPTSHQGNYNDRHEFSPNSQSRTGTRHSSIISDGRTVSPNPESLEKSGDATPSGGPTKEKSKRYGSRPTFWLDVLSPTDTEMRVISKTFGIHPLTAEDIMMQEAREKVELFRNYYLVNYRTFEQDMNSDNFLEPVNMYVVVFREGVISFHFSMTPHPANVRRRIRQLKDYLILSSDWISYAIIDDITDVFAPLIHSIENEVDEIDDAILQLHSGNKEVSGNDKSKSVKGSESGENTTGDSGGDMLRRVGEGRKKVMGLYRLLGNKADVIKGFAKRCNEHWEIAPRSEIGLYLGDIQDHIMTMTSNLSHYETLLSRAHSNYLAQINIRMNERQEQTADVLGKLTVLGTIVLPMNIITGMWGMNVLVPGQDIENLYWFWSITAGLIAFGVSCFFIAKRVYGIV